MQKSISALKKDKRFAKLIKKHGIPDLKWGRVGLKNSFRALVRSIIYQQVSGSAASSILKKFIKLFGRFPKPVDVKKVSVSKLHSAGLSSQKVKYIKDLAKKFLDGTIKHRSLRKMDNGEVIKHLIQVKGIGAWTAHMFLIFTLNRPDILPTGDLGTTLCFMMNYISPLHIYMNSCIKRNTGSRLNARYSLYTR